MKKIFMLLGTTACAFLITSSLAGQCVPDENCIDINEPGEICPANLPNAIVGTPYSQAITIIAPDSVGDFITLDIAYIVVDSVKNLPPGMSYTAYNDRYYPDTAYCIDVEGTPTTAGNYSLAIYVTPYLNYLGTLFKGDQVLDDSSVVVLVTSGTGINPAQTNEFQILNAKPNPFQNNTRLGYYIPFDDEVVLKVFNILGEEIYHEVMMGMHGENYFEFDGSALYRGAYFYGVTHKSAWYTGKFIKTE